MLEENSQILGRICLGTFSTASTLEHTQNQAFNALLFLFREVLRGELGDLSKTVRAKRGQRLPVTLSPEEVQELFKHVNPVRNDRALAPPSIRNEHFLFTSPS